MLKQLVVLGLVFWTWGSVAWGQGQEVRQYAPVPEATRGAAIPEKGYLVEPFGDGAYWVTEGSYTSILLVSDEGVIVVDASRNLGPNLLKAIREVTDQPVRYFIYSHHHADHTAGSGLLGPDVTRIAQEEAARELRRSNDPNRPLPDITFADSYTVELGGQRVELAYYGPNHSPGNIFIYLPRQKVLMAVDMFYPGWVPFQDFGVAVDIRGFFDAFDHALAYDFEHFVGGHLDRPGTRQEVELVREYVWDVRKNAADAIKSTDFMAVAGKVGFDNRFALFREYFDAVARNCTKVTLDKWVGRIGGADILAASLGWTMQLPLQID